MKLRVMCVILGALNNANLRKSLWSIGCVFKALFGIGGIKDIQGSQMRKRYQINRMVLRQLSKQVLVHTATGCSTFTNFLNEDTF